jgi:transposase
MLVQRAYKTELALNNEQITACRKHAGAARWAYNWGLARKQEGYRVTGTSPSAIDLHRELNALKQTDMPWMYEVSKCAPQEALRNLDTAFAHFFRRAKLKQQGKLRGKLGYPRFKTKKRGLGNFRLTGSIIVFADAIQLPRLGRLRLKERNYLPISARILSATVSEQAGHWYVSVLVEQEHVVPVNRGPVVGVDLGIKTLAPSRMGRSNRIRAIFAIASRSSSGCSARCLGRERAAAIARRRSVSSPDCIAM